MDSLISDEGSTTDPPVSGEGLVTEVINSCQPVLSDVEENSCSVKNQSNLQGDGADDQPGQYNALEQNHVNCTLNSMGDGFLCNNPVKEVSEVVAVDSDLGNHSNCSNSVNGETLNTESGIVAAVEKVVIDENSSEDVEVPGADSDIGATEVIIQPPEGFEDASNPADMQASEMSTNKQSDAVDSITCGTIDSDVMVEAGLSEEADKSSYDVCAEAKTADTSNRADILNIHCDVSTSSDQVDRLYESDAEMSLSAAESDRLDVGCIHFDAKEEHCHLSEPAILDSNVADAEDEEKLCPEEEDAAMEFLKLQEQKRNEEDFDDEFDVSGIEESLKPQAQQESERTPPVHPQPNDFKSESVFYDKPVVHDDCGLSKTISNSTFYSDNKMHDTIRQVDLSKGCDGEQKVVIPPSNVVGSVSYIESKVCSGDVRTEASARTNKEDMVDGSSCQSKPSMDDVDGSKMVSPPLSHFPISGTEKEQSSLLQSHLVDPNERSQDYTLKEDGGKPNALTAAKAEWDAVETITPDIQGDIDDSSTSGLTGPPVKTTPEVTYQESVSYLKASNVSQYKSQIRPIIQRGTWGSFKHAIFGPPKLHKNLQEERDLIFCMAACPFDDKNREDIHFQILQTIYKKLTGSKFDCQRYGDHWEHIGFQGADPSTDLRATGLLGLLCLLNLLSDVKTCPLARDIYKLSLHEIQNFPFCVMSINMTRIALQTLREESLNKDCNKRGSVLNVFNDVYIGIFLHMYQIWKQQHKTIKDSGYVLKDVETFAKKNPKAVLKNLEAYLSQKASGNAGFMEEGKALNFAGVCDFAHEDDGDLV